MYVVDQHMLSKQRLANVSTGYLSSGYEEARVFNFQTPPGTWGVFNILTFFNDTDINKAIFDIKDNFDK